MEDETIRTLITAFASTAAVLTTAVFGIVTHTRKEKITRLERKYKWTLEQFKSLYRTEKLYTAELETHMGEPASEIKKRFRKKVVEQGNDHIELTDTRASKTLQKLG